MYLVESLTNRHAALFQFDLHQRQAINQDSYVITVSVRACLFKLLDNLHFIAHEILFIYQIDVLKTPVIKNKVANIVDMDFTGLIQNAIARVVQILLRETPPLAVIKHHTIEALKLFPNIGQHCRL